MGQEIRRRGWAARIVALAAAAALAGCEAGPGSGWQNGAKTSAVPPGDVEAPQVFQASEAGLWDGRPSLGGIWVAHPDVRDPEKVLIRNAANGETVIGALFRRERAMPGPRLQVSSEAAAELGMLAGAPVELNVTALRPAPQPAMAEPADDKAADRETAEDATPAQAETAEDTKAGDATAGEETGFWSKLFGKPEETELTQ